MTKFAFQARPYTVSEETLLAVQAVCPNFNGDTLNLEGEVIAQGEANHGTGSKLVVVKTGDKFVAFMVDRNDHWFWFREISKEDHRYLGDKLFLFGYGEIRVKEYTEGDMIITRNGIFITL